MPNKAYAILLSVEDEDNGSIYFPIKREGRNYGGMPQFFGGTKEGNESDRETIDRELQEESDNKLSLKFGDLTLVHDANINGDSYKFYVAQHYEGMHFLGPLKNDEMSRIESFFVQISAEDDIENLLTKLKIVPSEVFTQSETYEAFDKAIKWCETN